MTSPELSLFYADRGQNPTVLEGICKIIRQEKLDVGVHNFKDIGEVEQALSCKITDLFIYHTSIFRREDLERLSELHHHYPDLTIVVVVKEIPNHLAIGIHKEPNMFYIKESKLTVMLPLTMHLLEQVHWTHRFRK